MKGWLRTAMGSTCYIITNPAKWDVFDEGKTLNQYYQYEPILKIRYGGFEDYPSGEIDLEMYMRRSVFDKLVNRTYKVSEQSKWKRQLIITDMSGNYIEPVRVDFCY